MRITYSDPDGNKRVGDYWGDGPMVKSHKDVRWVISPEGLSVLIGKPYRKKTAPVVIEEYVQIAKLKPGERLQITKNGEVLIT